jgi:hypothetical protein
MDLSTLPSTAIHNSAGFPLPAGLNSLSNLEFAEEGLFNVLLSVAAAAVELLQNVWRVCLPLQKRKQTLSVHVSNLIYIHLFYPCAPTKYILIATRKPSPSMPPLRKKGSRQKTFPILTGARASESAHAAHSMHGIT